MESANDKSAKDPCPIAPVVELLLGRWTSPILYGITKYGPLRFSELQMRAPYITAKVLTERLRHLERNGFVRRLAQHGTGRRVQYEATPLAETLIPVFGALIDWSDLHLAEVRAVQNDFDRRSRLIS